MAAFLFLIILMSVPLASAHGLKGRGTEFTALDAAKKGLELYDKLLTSGKIEQMWVNTNEVCHIVAYYS